LAAAGFGLGVSLVALIAGRLTAGDGRFVATVTGMERTGVAGRLEAGADAAGPEACEPTAVSGRDEGLDAGRVAAGCRTVRTTVRVRVGRAPGGASGSGRYRADAGGVSGPGYGVLVPAQAAAGVANSNAHAHHHSPPLEPLGRSFDAHWDTAPPSHFTVRQHVTEVNESGSGRGAPWLSRPLRRFSYRFGLPPFGLRTPCTPVERASPYCALQSSWPDTCSWS
jgi:hypothetical protein